ncbi:c-type cytochrome [Dyella caseinilytica]|uniref:C-type cytochrome n=1 Tax=Dyella caseinilytica TaxID=1849581 RepID=A0ABX7GVL3_9GAMM|nr:c-type cytochrome [Dyella caseinilytica]QRN54003.1 c-type cytochrome [Dyella caseinilytica]GFZ90826.1 cytochrome c [Dyella caseinilytica]
MKPKFLILMVSASLLAACDHSTPQASAPATQEPAHAASSAKAEARFEPPAESTIPNDDFGKQIALGRQIFMDPGTYAKAYVGNQLSCENCHLDAGRLAHSAPLWGAYPMYPAYRSKNHHVNTFAERLQGCFNYSMNGKAPPLGDPVLVALESYAYWMSKGEPIGTSLPGRGYPKLAKPAQAPDYARGETVYKRDCALCHGDDGQGQQAASRTVFPPLWGPQSFNWGAGMEQITNAAGFIKANMPLGRGNTLTDQDAWDVAYFMDAHERPQDPRYKDSVAATREAYHDTPDSLYGVTVNGHVLGQGISTH